MRTHMYVPESYFALNVRLRNIFELENKLLWGGEVGYAYMPTDKLANYDIQLNTNSKTIRSQIHYIW